MLRKTPALPGLSPVAENIFMLQRKWANCLCHYQNAATTSGSSSLLKFSSWKARSKEAVMWNHCIIILVHEADTCFSASLAHVFYSRPVSDVRGCPEKRALQSVWCICKQEPCPSPHKYLPKRVKTAVQNLQRHLKMMLSWSTIIQNTLYVVIFLVHLQIL